MTYVDDHIDWLTDQGATVLPADQAIHLDKPVPPVDASFLSRLPPDVATWFEARLWGRADSNDVLAFASGIGAMSALGDPVTMFQESPSDFRLAQSESRFPKKPMVFAVQEHCEFVVELEGERSGWLYSYGLMPEDCVPGPFACSIPEYLAAVRGLVGVDLLRIGSNAPWYYDDPSAVRPPDDTPGPLVSGLSSVYEVEFGTLEQGEPYAPSIRDILPNFTYVTMPDSPDRPTGQY